MKDETKLYDLRQRDYPNKRGDVFRTLQIFECWVCLVRTNRVVMGGAMGLGARMVCPYSAECWHHELEDKIKLSRRRHPRSYINEIEREIEEMRRQHQHEIKDDILGEVDYLQKWDMTNVRGYKSDMLLSCEFCPNRTRD